MADRKIDGYIVTFDNGSRRRQCWGTPKILHSTIEEAETEHREMMADATHPYIGEITPISIVMHPIVKEIHPEDL